MHILLAAPADTCAGLQRHIPPNNTLEAVPTAEDALLYLRTTPPDILFASANLPDMPVLKLLKAVRTYSAVPVVLTDVTGPSANISTLFDAGADDVLPALQPETLRARMQAMLRRHRANAATSVLQVGNVSLQMHPPRVEVNGFECSLKPKQHAVLQHLMLAQNRIVTHDNLLYAIGSTECNGNIIATYISLLRGELKKSGGNLKLECIHRLGYRLTAPAATPH